jgi:hypothetical protein
MSDRLKYSYSVPLRTAWQMSQNFHASVEYCCPIWLVKANNTSTQPMLITPSLNMVDTILLYVCTLSFSMSEWFIFALFSVFIGFWPHHCFKLVGLILCALMCCPCGAHTLCFNVLSLGDHTLCFNVLFLWGSYSVL